MWVAAFAEADLVLTFIVLLFSLTFCSRCFWYCLVCGRDQKYFWKDLEERWRWNLSLISHLLSMLFDWTLIDSQCWANRFFSNLKVTMRSFSNGNQSLKIIFNYLVCNEASDTVGVKAVDGVQELVVQLLAHGGPSVFTLHGSWISWSLKPPSSSRQPLIS